MLNISFAPNRDCSQLIYLIGARSGKAVYKGTFQEELTDSCDLSGFSGEDLLVKAYVRSDVYPQRKSAIAAALIWDEASQSFRTDDGSRYPYLNLRYLGQHSDQTGENSYSFTIDYQYSLTVSQKWYIYKNGGYYAMKTTKDSDTLDYTFTEPGDYTIIYYLHTLTGDTEFRNFAQIHID